jgi:crotonobetainyl-CoA:carnitine CoA-transferase CaiB-like acyl-CoA transferase
MDEKFKSFLEGYRVLDLSDEKGHLCGKLLGDLGADVIKIEPPAGDSARTKGPFYKDIPDPEKSLQWFFANLNKRGITLNLETADGKEIFMRLAAKADFIIESFAPGYMESMGLGYNEIEKIKPSIIVTSITPFGQKGPYSEYKTTDLTGVSMGGLIRLYGEVDGPPVRISAPQFYYLGSIHAAMGSMVAHYHRELTGEGQYVDVSCQQAVVLANRISVETYNLLKINPRGSGPNTPVPRPTPPGPLAIPIVKKCKDGYLVAFILGGSAAGFVKSSRNLVKWANEEDMAMELKDFEWENMDGSVITQAEINELHGIIDKFLLTKTKAELMKHAIEKEMLIIPVNTTQDLAESQQLSHREFWMEVAHPELNDMMKYPAWPVKWTQLQPYKPQRRAPLIGEHNHEIYMEELGLSKDQLVMLKTLGII